MRSHKVCSKLFNQAGQRYAGASGGFVRVIPTRVRRGDAAPMAIVEIVPEAPAE